MIPAGRSSQGWRGAVRARMQEVDPRFLPIVDSMRCELNGKEVREDCPMEELHNAVLRWRSGALLGGAPKAIRQDAEPDFDAMNQVELRQAAKELKVPVKQSAETLRAACKRAAEAQHKSKSLSAWMKKSDREPSASAAGQALPPPSDAPGEVLPLASSSGQALPAKSDAACKVVTVEHRCTVTVEQTSMGLEWKVVLQSPSGTLIASPLSAQTPEYWTQERSPKLRRILSKPQSPAPATST